MEINLKNQDLYHKAFVSEDGWGDAVIWRPSINESEIEDWSCTLDGKVVPATPLGFRDYSEGRLDGVKSILKQEPDVTMTLNELSHCKKGQEPFKQYDHLYVSDQDDHFVIAGYDNAQQNILVVSVDSYTYSVKLKSENDE